MSNIDVMYRPKYSFTQLVTVKCLTIHVYAVHT